MNNDICLLVYVSNGNSLIQHAIKIKNGRNNDHFCYPMEPEHKEYIHSLLPEHIRSFGDIVFVGELTDISSVEVD